MSEGLKTKVIGANIEDISNNTKKFFRVVVITNTESDYPLTEYLRNNTSLFCKQYEQNGADVDCDYYFNSSYGIAMFYFMAEVHEGGTYNESDFANSEAISFVIDINEILAGQDANDHPFMHVFDHTGNPDITIETIDRLRKDVVFKSDLYAGKLLGDISSDFRLLFNVNQTLPSNAGVADLDEMTKDEERPISHYLLQRDNIQRDIDHKSGIIEELKAKKAKLEEIIESMGGDPYKRDESVPREPIDFIKEIFDPSYAKDLKPEPGDLPEEKEVKKESKSTEETSPKSNNISEVERTPEDIEKQDRTIEEVEKILSNLDVNVTTSEVKDEVNTDDKVSIKEKIKEETKEAQSIINPEDITNIADKTDVTKETLLEPKVTETEPDNVSKEEATIYDTLNQGRDINEYVEKLITSDEDFSGDWDDEQELFQIVMSNDSKVREELSKDEYKAYLDLVTRYSLNKNDKQELNSGVYNLRRAKFDNIGSFDYVND